MGATAEGQCLDREDTAGRMPMTATEQNLSFTRFLSNTDFRAAPVSYTSKYHVYVEDKTWLISWMWLLF